MRSPPFFITNTPALSTSPLHRDALSLVEAGIAAAHPRTVLPAALRCDGDTLTLGEAQIGLGSGRLFVIGGGKAAGAMASALEDVVGADRITAGVVNALPGPWATQRIALHPSTHPTPSPQGVRGVDRMLALPSHLASEDLVICLISGGASAMMAAPAAGVTLRDKQRLTRLLLRSGASIAEINTVRRHLSRTKGGRLAQHLQPARVLTLLIADHVGGRLEVIGSGPTLPDPTTFADAVAVLHRFGLWERSPLGVRDYLTAGATGAVADTPKADDPCFARTHAYVLANTATAVDGMHEAAVALGFPEPAVLSYQIAGEAREAARVVGAVVRHAYEGLPPGGSKAILFGSEMTVTIRGRAGTGGRCQEFGAAMAQEITGLDGCVVAAIGTDGTDFTPGVGGAMVDGATAGRARARGLDIDAALARHDTGPLHHALGTLVEMGPTGTNVCDLFVCLMRKPGV